MAKLSAHGEEARIEKHGSLSDGTTTRTTMVLAEDGVLLHKTNFYHPDGRLDFSTGWKRLGRINTGQDEWIRAFQARGWRVA